MPRIGLPVKSIGRACGSETASSCASGPTATIRSSRTIPQAIRSPTMNARPPNILRSVTSSRSPRTVRIRDANASSYAMIETQSAEVRPFHDIEPIGIWVAEGEHRHGIQDELVVDIDTAIAKGRMIGGRILRGEAQAGVDTGRIVFTCSKQRDARGCPSRRQLDPTKAFAERAIHPDLEAELVPIELDRP